MCVCVVGITKIRIRFIHEWSRVSPVSVSVRQPPSYTCSYHISCTAQSIIRSRDRQQQQHRQFHSFIIFIGWLLGSSLVGWFYWLTATSSINSLDQQLSYVPVTVNSSSSSSNNNNKGSLPIHNFITYHVKKWLVRLEPQPGGPQ